VWGGVPLVSLAVLAGQAPAPSSSELPLSLRDAFRNALSHNPEFVVLRENVEEARARLSRAESVFVPRIFGGVTGGRLQTPPSPTNLETTDDSVVGSLAIGGVFLTGLEYRLELSAQYHALDSVFSVYDRIYQSGLRFQLEQPLLRHAWPWVTEAPIRIAAHRRDASNLLQQARAERILADVEVAYWLLVLAHGELALRNAALQLSKAQVKASKAQLRHGAVAQFDVIEAQAAVARDLEVIQRTVSDIAMAEGQLARLIFPEYGSTETSYKPVDQPDAKLPVTSIDDSLKTAFARRPDLAAAEANLEAEQVAREVTENALWPAVSLVGSVGVGGSSGRLSPGFGTSSFGIPTQHGITGELLPPVLPDSRSYGGFVDQFSNWRSVEALVGVEVEIPFENSLAESDARIQRAAAALQRAEVERVRSTIYYEVVTAHRQLLADYERVKATLRAVELAEKLLEAQQTRFKNGVAVSFDVLRASNAVTEARSANLRARIQSQISRARLALARGVYMEENGVELVADEEPE
jgi:outer membrane protein TolC